MMALRQTAPAVRGRPVVAGPLPRPGAIPRARRDPPAPATPRQQPPPPRRRPAWYIPIPLFSLGRIRRESRLTGLSDKRSRVLPESRRTRVLYSHLLVSGRLAEVNAR